MRLLRCTNSGEFGLTKDLVGDDTIPPYSILSHTWGPDTAEVTFEDLTNGIGKNILILATPNLLMFRWYRDATRCYVYLSDVSR
jgi:hypothetical protein